MEKSKKGEGVGRGGKIGSSYIHPFSPNFHAMENLYLWKISFCAQVMKYVRMYFSFPTPSLFFLLFSIFSQGHATISFPVELHWQRFGMQDRGSPGGRALLPVLRRHQLRHRSKLDTPQIFCTVRTNQLIHYKFLSLYNFFAK